MTQQQLDDLANFVSFLNIENTTDDGQGKYRIALWETNVYGNTKGEAVAEAIRLYAKLNDIVQG